MKKTLSLCSVVAGGLLLAGCATPWDVSDVRTIAQTPTPAGGTAFTRALFDEYKAATKYEAEVEYEWDDAAIFARKGLTAAAGIAPAPAQVAEVPPGREGELMAARERLVSALAAGAGDRVPALAAKAQVNFDCWVEEEMEGDTNSKCRADFLAIDLGAPKPMAKIVKTFVIYFDFNKAVITPAADKTLHEVAAAQAEIKPANIFVSGYTDTVGSSAYNMKLSERRAEATTAALDKLGVKSSKFDVKSYGKDKLAVPTADNVKEQKNRRVEIYFEK